MFADIMNVLLFQGKRCVQMRENKDYIPSKETLQHVQVDRSVTNMSELLDRDEAGGESRGIIEGTVATCLEFGMDVARVLEKIIQQYHLEEPKFGSIWKG